MQRLGELLFMLAGTAVVGAYLYLPTLPDDAPDRAEFTHVSIAPYHKARADNGAVRSFSPASPVFRDEVKTDGGSATTESAPLSDAWTTIVRPRRSAKAVLRSAQPGDAATRYELAVDLQRELKRAGCYGGEINGVWGQATKRAMTAFLDHANATLPIKTPDYILLSLVQNRNEISCTAACRTGQVKNQSGRCVPNTVIAETSKQSSRGVADAQPTDAARAPEQLPWLDRDGRSRVATTPAAERPAPPPGMMSIGGPIASASASANGAPVSGASASVADPDAAKVATLSPGDDAADDAGSAANTEPDALATEKSYHAKKSRSWRERARHSRSAGRHRRGDPRPGTARYNLVQALGGIY
jgi:hypothetical protein